MLNIHSLISNLFTLSILLGFGQLSQGESLPGENTRDTLILEIFLIFLKLAVKMHHIFEPLQRADTAVLADCKESSFL